MAEVESTEYEAKEDFLFGGVEQNFVEMTNLIQQVLFLKF